jgi:hypothetical protein
VSSSGSSCITSSSGSSCIARYHGDDQLLLGDRHVAVRPVRCCTRRRSCAAAAPALSHASHCQQAFGK